VAGLAADVDEDGVVVAVLVVVAVEVVVAVDVVFDAGAVAVVVVLLEAAFDDVWLPPIIFSIL
jgi:hypothetical protein